MSKIKKFAICKCIFEKNIFLRDLKLHVTYKSDEQFINDYSSRIQNIDNALKDAREEAIRRIKVANEVVERRDIIKNRFTPLLPELYSFNHQFLTPEFLSTSTSTNNITQIGKNLFTFPVFTQEFCNMFISELKHFTCQNIPHRQPNSMNRYGILLDDILGFNDFFDSFRELHLQPLTRKLFPDLKDIELDSQKAFVVKYKIGEDIDLAEHFDNAEVTLNVSLSNIHTGGEIVFRGDSGKEFDLTIHEHRFGEGILHLGRHLHKALPIESGERWNLIIWMRSSEKRNKICPMCQTTPEKIPAPFYGDGFTV